MKTKFYFAAMAAVVGFGLTSCSQEEQMSPSVDNATLGAISYKSTLAKTIAGSTRGTSIQGTNYLDNTLVPNMKVWGYFVPGASGTGITPGGQYVGQGGDGIVIKNYSEVSPAKNLWDYENLTEVAYWPTAALNFYAIIPATDGSFTTAAAVGGSNIAHVTADVTIPTTVTDQKDILFAQAVNQTGRTGADNSPVAFDFNHALSQVVFKGKLASANLSAEIESITVCNACQKGTVGFTSDNLTTAVLGATTDAGKTVAKFAAGLVADPSLDGNTDVSTPKDLVATNGALMMLPQDRTADKWTTAVGSPVSTTTADTQKQTYLAISCKIKNGDSYVMGTAADFATVYIPFTINWEQGKKYTYCLVFGKGQGGFDEDGNPISSLLPITYTLHSVTDWSEVDGGDIEF